MESGMEVTEEQKDESLILQLAADAPDMVTETMEVEQRPGVGNLAECQPKTQMREGSSLPGVGNIEQSEPDECICTVHCKGPEEEEGKE